MTKKTRLTILLVCVACFFIGATVLVPYSMGYRFDFKKNKIVATGGIYIRTNPSADEITIDSKITQKPGMFSNWIFVQSLLPDNHTVSIKKSEYYDYFKTLPVLEKEVTKLEDVLLFKKDIQFNAVTDETLSPFNILDKYIIKNSNLYYSDAPENSTLTATQKTTPIIKKIIAFATQNNNIIWLGTDGFLYSSDSSSLSATPDKITITPIKILKTSSYKIITDNNNTFVIANQNLLLLNGKTNELDNFSTLVKNAKISPDGKNITYFNDNNIYISPLPNIPALKTILYKSSNKISDCIWLNSSYIIFTVEDKIITSEIDYRGNINSVTLPQTADKIFFNQQEGKLYVLSGKTLLGSEKITQ
ncbi:MAG: hypothetical protein NTW11_02225 [Candidatus Staskawiczbacteria bacterium]|nr:hypothetical protein [Candidatus Staskawiczbacteria bacterium]